MSLFDYLTQMALGSIRVSDRVPGVSGTAQRGIVVLSASAEMPKIHVWDAMQIIRDPYSGAGAGKVTITATALVSAALHAAWRGTGYRSPTEALLSGLQMAKDLLKRRTARVFALRSNSASPRHRADASSGRSWIKRAEPQAPALNCSSLRAHAAVVLQRALHVRPNHLGVEDSRAVAVPGEGI